MLGECLQIAKHLQCQVDEYEAALAFYAALASASETGITEHPTGRPSGALGNYAFSILEKWKLSPLKADESKPQ